VLLVEAPLLKKQQSWQLPSNIWGANKHHIPKQVICMDAFMHTHSGKLDRKATIKRLHM